MFKFTTGAVTKVIPSNGAAKQCLIEEQNKISRQKPDIQPCSLSPADIPNPQFWEITWNNPIVFQFATVKSTSKCYKSLSSLMISQHLVLWTRCTSYGVMLLPFGWYRHLTTQSQQLCCLYSYFSPIAIIMDRKFARYSNVVIISLVQPNISMY